MQIRTLNVGRLGTGALGAMLLVGLSACAGEVGEEPHDEPSTAEPVGKASSAMMEEVAMEVGAEACIITRQCVRRNLLGVCLEFEYCLGNGFSCSILCP